MSSARPDIRPAFAERNIAVSFSTDENYLPYVAVAINSIVENTKSGYTDILVLHDGIPQAKRSAFLAGFEKKENVSVRFVDVKDAVAATGLSGFRQKRYLSVAACYRLLLPDMLVAYDKIIYLDVDTVVCEDLGTLYETDLGDSFFGAALNIVNSSGKQEYAAWAKGYGFEEWNEYVNTGVTIFNLREFRKAALLDKLIPIAMDASKWFCDQDALNFVCKGRIKRLDPRWNVQVGDYCIRQQTAITGNEAYVYHFTGDRKPWSNPEHMMAHHWWRHAGNDGSRLWRAAFGIDGETVLGDGIAVSVVVPVYNAAPYLSEMLVSLSAQTLRNIEIICVDDGSTDGSAAILSEFAASDSRIKVITQKNSGGAIARNRGIEEAKGRWLFFADADDFCRPDMLAEMVADGEAKESDIVVVKRFEVNTRRIGICTETNLPKRYLECKDVVNCKTPWFNPFDGCGFAPWNKLYRTDFVISSGIRFHQTPPNDDVYFVLVSLIEAKRIALLNKAYYYYRVFLPSSQMGLADKNPTNFLVSLLEVKEIVAEQEEKIQKEYFPIEIACCFENLIARKTRAGREATYAAIRDGGLDALRLPLADECTIDLGLCSRAFAMTKARADVEDVIVAYYEDKRDAILQRERTEGINLRKYGNWLNETRAELKALDERLKGCREAYRRDVAKLKERLAAAEARSDKLEAWLRDKTERCAAAAEHLKEYKEAYQNDVARLKERLVAADKKLGEYRESYRRDVARLKERLAVADAKLTKRNQLIKAICATVG